MSVKLYEDEVKAITEERKWWNDILQPMGYHLIGCKGKHVASAGSDTGGGIIEVSGAIAEYLHSIKKDEIEVAESYADDFIITKGYLSERIDELRVLNLELIENNLGLEDAIMRVRDRNEWLEGQLRNLV